MSYEHTTFWKDHIGSHLTLVTNDGLIRRMTGSSLTVW